MRSKIIARIVIYSVIALLLLTILTAALTFRSYSFSHNKITSGLHSEISNRDNGTVLLNADSVSNMEIAWASGNITIEPGDTEEIQITEYCEKNSKPMEVITRGDTLVINYHADKKISGINFIDSKSLTIHVPRDWSAKRLVINGASAKINLNGLTILNVDVNTASGACTIQDCEIDSLDVDSASGEVTFSGCLKEFDMDCASAKAELTLFNTPDSISMDSASGDLELTLPEDCGFTAELDSLSGKIKSDFDLSTNKNGFYYGDSHCRIEMSGMSGGMHIHHGAAASNHPGGDNPLHK